VHRHYLAAARTSRTTNTFTATSIGQADYDLQHLVRDMNVEAAGLARQAADEFGGRYVAWLDRSAERDAVDCRPGSRTGLPRGDLRAGQNSYAEQISASRGRVDLRWLETIFDTLNCKAAIAAARKWRRTCRLWILGDDRRPVRPHPVGADGGGVLAVDRARQAAGVGVNCSLGATEMRPHLVDLARLADTTWPATRNAGLPNAFGGYDETPNETSRLIGEFAESQLVNIVGGCCRHDPGAHREDRRDGPEPASPAAADDRAGDPVQRLEPFEDRPGHRFRDDRRADHVTGSARFRRPSSRTTTRPRWTWPWRQVRGGANLWT